MKKLTIIFAFILMGCWDRIDGVLTITNISAMNDQSGCQYLVKRVGKGDSNFYYVYDACGKYAIGDTLKLSK